jgi:hypothetical protein
MVLLIRIYLSTYLFINFTFKILKFDFKILLKKMNRFINNSSMTDLKL